MVTFDELAAAAPETAEVFRRRLAATGLALLATLRADGFPRISPFEAVIADGDLWLGSMPGSTKSADLRREPRCCVHSATEDKDVKDGDAKLWGRAVEVTSDDDRRRYAAAVREASGYDLDEAPGGFDLFRIDITAASALQVGADGEHLRITRWKAGGREEVVERR